MHQKKEKASLDDELAVKEEMFSSNELAYNKLAQDTENLYNNLNALQQYMDELRNQKVTLTKTNMADSHQLGAMSQKLGELLKTVNLLSLQIKKIEEEVSRSNTEKDIIKSENNSIQLKLLSTTDAMEVVRLSQIVESNNRKLAEIEQGIAQTLRDKLDKGKEYDWAYKEANNYIDGMGLDYKELIEQEDMILAEVRYAATREENEVFRNRAEERLQQAQDAYNHAVINLDTKVAEFAVITARELSNSEADVTTINHQFAEIKSKIETAPDVEKPRLISEKIQIENKLREAMVAVDKIKAKNLKSTVDIKQRLEKEVAIAKTNLDKAKRDIESAEYRIKSALTIEQAKNMMVSGSGILSSERKDKAERQERLKAEQEEFRLRREKIKQEGNDEIAYCKNIQANILKAQNGNDAARKLIEDTLVSRMTEDERSRYYQMSTGEKWRYAIMDAEERIRRATYDTQDKLLALDAEEQIRMVQYESEGQVEDARKQAEVARKQAEEQMARAQKDVDYAKKQVEEFELRAKTDNIVSGAGDDDRRRLEEQLVVAQAELERVQVQAELDVEEAKAKAIKDNERIRNELETLKSKTEEEIRLAKEEAERVRATYAMQGDQSGEVAEIKRKADKEIALVKQELEELRRQAETETDKARREAEEATAEMRRKADEDMERLRQELAASQGGTLSVEDEEAIKLMRQEEEERILAAVEADRESRLEELRKAEESRLLAERDAEQTRQELEMLRVQFEEESARIKEESERAKEDAERVRAEAEAVAEEMRRRAEETRLEAEAAADVIKRQAEEEVELARRELEALRRQAETDSERSKREIEDKTSEARRLADIEIEKLREELLAANEGAALSKEEEEALRSMRAAEEEKILAEAEADRLAKQQEVESAERARQDAEDALRYTREELERQQAYAEQLRQDAEVAKRQAEEEAEKAKQELLEKARQDEEQLEKTRKEELEKLENSKRIADKVALRRIDILRLKEQIVDIKGVADAKAIVEKLGIINNSLDENEKSSTELTDMLNRAIMEATHAGEIVALRQQLRTRPAGKTEPSRERRIMKKVVERINRVAPPRKRRPAGARPARRLARPGARPMARPGARPMGARPPMVRPGARPMARPPMARPTGARPVGRPLPPRR